VAVGGGGGGALGRTGGPGLGTSPASPNTIRVEPTFTTSPSLARRSRIFPVTGEGIWTVTLSVITSTTGSFSLTESPSFTNHLTTSPSWTPSPMSGSLNSRAIRRFPGDIPSKPGGQLNGLHVHGVRRGREQSFYGQPPFPSRGGVGSWRSGTDRWA